MEEKAIYDQIHFDVALTTVMEKPRWNFYRNLNYRAFACRRGNFHLPQRPEHRHRHIGKQLSL